MSSLIPTETIGVCNNCGSLEHRSLASSVDFEYRTCENEFQFVACSDCGLQWLKNRPAPSTLGTIYPSSYIPYHFNEHLGPLIARLRSWVQAKKIAPIRQYAPNGSLIIDIGCGSGEMLRLLRAQGNPSWELAGVDFAQEAIDNLERLGIKGICGRFEAMEWPLKAPQVMVMNQVIEHLDDPARVVARAFDLLAPGGVLVIETPSVDAWDARLFRKRYWGGWHTPRHWILYNPQTLRALLEVKGFRVVETTAILSPNFWLQSFHHMIEERFSAPRLANLFDVKVLPSLAVASAIDVVQKILTGKTSNFRMVGVKP